jgi:hypothetical protein
VITPVLRARWRNTERNDKEPRADARGVGQRSGMSPEPSLGVLLEWSSVNLLAVDADGTSCARLPTSLPNGNARDSSSARRSARAKRRLGGPACGNATLARTGCGSGRILPNPERL